jgi:4-hydroxy-tetrahydrodipicolinate reductase
MKIALIGYGKLGHQIEQIAQTKGHEIIAKFSSQSPPIQESKETLQNVDVCIDFSSPYCVVDNIKALAEQGKSVVVGTTGWYDQLNEVKDYVLNTNIGFLYAPNFSIGMLRFMQIIKEAAKLFNKLPEYDVGGMEIHHNQKVDSPSGTAETLANILLEELKRKRSVVYETLDREIAPSELHFASLRCGSTPGTHTIYFDSPNDTIELTHRVRDRAGLARGAVAAAEWLRNKKGFYSLNDMFN